MAEAIAPQEAVKGRVFIFLENDQQPRIGDFSGFGFRLGVDSGNLEVNEKGLGLWKENLILPKDYELVRVYYGINKHKWTLVLESDVIPLVYKDLAFEEAKPTVAIIPRDLGEKTVHITHLELPEFTDDKYQRRDGTVRCLMPTGKEALVPTEGMYDQSVYSLCSNGTVKQIRPKPPKHVDWKEG